MKYFRYIFLLIFFSLTAFAKVTLKAPNSFIKNEPYYFEFEAIGSSIKFPEIKTIDNYVVEPAGTSRTLQIVNGNYDEKISKRFMILPKNDFQIPSFSFNIKGVEIKTKPKKVLEKKISKTASQNFDLSLVANKDELYVGEDLVVKLIFKYKRGIQITDLGFEKPHFENFWYEKLNNSNRSYEENGFVVQELDFLLFPQKSGDLKISPLRVDVQLLKNNFSNRTFSFLSNNSVVKKIYSNDLSFKVKELPLGVKLLGDFDITASVDKKLINQGESISYKLKIKGIGNFEDIKDLKLDINNATVYDNKPEIKTNYTKKGNEGEYTKVFSIVPNASLEIPPLRLSFYDKNKQEVVSKKTEAFKIEVKNQKSKSVVLEKAKVKEVKKEFQKEEKIAISFMDKMVYFILGIAFTLLIFGLYKYANILKSKKSSKMDTNLISLVKKAKVKDELLRVLVPYLKIDDGLDELIYQCESKKEFKILKKEIIDKLKEINI